MRPIGRFSWSTALAMSLAAELPTTIACRDKSSSAPREEAAQSGAQAQSRASAARSGAPAVQLRVSTTNEGFEVVMTGDDSHAGARWSLPRSPSVDDWREAFREVDRRDPGATGLGVVVHGLHDRAALKSFVEAARLAQREYVRCLPDESNCR